MNHLKIYEDIIKRAQNENRQRVSSTNKDHQYYEEHHILPRCLGGLDVKENLVLLTLREHFLCHKLLVYIYSKTPGIILAFRFMSNFLLKYNVSSRDYQYAKELYRALPASEKTKKKRLEVWYEINCSEKAIDDYLDSLKRVHFWPDLNSSVHIPFKR